MSKENQVIEDNQVILEAHVLRVSASPVNKRFKYYRVVSAPAHVFRHVFQKAEYFRDLSLLEKLSELGYRLMINTVYIDCSIFDYVYFGEMDVEVEKPGTES